MRVELYVGGIYPAAYPQPLPKPELREAVEHIAQPVPRAQVGAVPYRHGGEESKRGVYEVVVVAYAADARVRVAPRENGIDNRCSVGPPIAGCRICEIGKRGLLWGLHHRHPPDGEAGGDLPHLGV